MELSYIKKIIKLVEHSNVDEVEIEEEGRKIRVARSRPVPTALAYQIPQGSFYAPPHAGTPEPEPAPQVTVAPPSSAAEPSFHEIRSPIVGTFYRAPSPDAEPYVEVGHRVKRGDVLCIVEAMKLMNEIESDVDGEIVKIMVENAKPVEYNQVLFLIRPVA